MTHHHNCLYPLFLSLLWLRVKKAARLLATLGGPLKVVALLPSLHANMHHWLFLFYLDPAASSPVLSWSHLGYKKEGHLYKKDYVLWKTQWHKNMAGAVEPKSHTWAVHRGLSSTPFPLGRVLIEEEGAYQLPVWEYTQVCTEQEQGCGVRSALAYCMSFGMKWARRQADTEQQLTSALLW